MKKTVRRILSVVMVLVLVLGSLSVSGLAAGEDISVKTDRSECLQGEKITVTIFFPSKFQKVASMDLLLRYDSAKFTLKKVTDGAAIDNALDAQTHGKVYARGTKTAGQISWGIAGSDTLVFSGTFATAEFEAKKSSAAVGNAEFRLDVTDAANANRESVKTSINTGSTTVNIIKVAANDIVFDLNDEGTGYVALAYYTTSSSELNIPKTYAGLPVVEIADNAFFNHAELKKVTIPDSVVSIGSGAFKGCSGITEITVPDSVETIGSSAFEGCTSLTKAVLPIGLKTIKTKTFKGCSFLEKADIPFTVTTVESEAFADCLCLEEIKIAKTTTNVADDAFKGSFDSPTFVISEKNTGIPAYIEKYIPGAKTRTTGDISLGTATVTDKVQYTGKAITPAVKVTLTSGATVVRNRHYKVVFKNNTEKGTATVYVAGIGDYGDGYTLHFTIYCEHKNCTEKITAVADCTHEGSKEVTCTLCGEVMKKTIPANGHSDGDWVYDVRPTIRTTGLKHQLCSVCKKTIKNDVVVPKVYPDVDGDGLINSSDALLILQYSTGLYDKIPTENQKINADTDGDGEINSSDALTILQISIGQIVL